MGAWHCNHCGANWPPKGGPGVCPCGGGSQMIYLYGSAPMDESDAKERAFDWFYAEREAGLLKAELDGLGRVA